VDAPWVRHYQPGVPAEIELPTESLVALYERSVAEAGDAVATEFFGRTTTYAELGEQIERAAEGLRRLGVQPGDRVAILGAGPIGLLVGFWARRMGASRVVMADRHMHQRERALRLGATDYVLSDANLSQRLADASGGPPDIVFECVGKPGLLKAATDAVKLQGKVIGVGLCIGGDEWDPFVALSKEIDLIFSVFFHQKNEFGVALDALAGGPFAPQQIITDRIDLSLVPQVFEGLRQRTTQCKVLIQPELA